MATVSTQSELTDLSVSGTKVVNTSSDPLNLRATPSTSATIITTIPRGTTVSVLDATASVSGWTPIAYGTVRGFVYSTYLADSLSDSSSSNSTTTSTLLSSMSLTDTQKKALVIGASVLVAGGLAFGVYKMVKKKKSSNLGLAGFRRRKRLSLGRISRSRRTPSLFSSRLSGAPRRSSRKILRLR